MMNSSQQFPSRLPESDLELLSAYLDRQLSVAERVNLERRIAAEPTLRAELESLRETAAALRALEPLRPPRSFTLDPATAPKPRFYFPIAWVMQLGSGLAGLALVLLATVQMISVGAVPASTSAPMAPKEAPTMEAAAAEAPYSPDPGAMREAAPTAAPLESSASVLMESGPMATAPAAAAQPAPTPAPTAAPAAGEPAADGASTTAEEVPEANAPAAGGAAAGPYTNSSPAEGMGAAGSAPQSTVQSTDTSSPDTANLPAARAEEPGVMGFLPGLTLALGVALIGLGVVWHLYSRRS